jgi:hypothetical protein
VIKPPKAATNERAGDIPALAICVLRVNREELTMQEDDLFKMAKVSPLDALKECHTRLLCAEQGYHKELYHCVAGAYAVAYALVRDPKCWRSFAIDLFWDHFKKRPKLVSPKRPLLNVMVYVFHGTCKNAYSRAQKYAAALQKYFDQGMKPEEIEALIEQKGGLEAMACVAAAARRIELEIQYEADLERLDESFKDVEPKGDNDIDQQPREPDQKQEEDDRADKDQANEQQDDGDDEQGENHNKQRAEDEDLDDQEADSYKDSDDLGYRGWKDIKVPTLVTFWISPKLYARLLELDYRKKARLTIRGLGDPDETGEEGDGVVGRIVGLKRV